MRGQINANGSGICEAQKLRWLVGGIFGFCISLVICLVSFSFCAVGKK